MSLWAIVPVKPLRRGKSRLASILTEDERTFLNYSMMGHMMKTLAAVPAIDRVLVISRDPAALAMARDFGARTVLEDSNSELNMALQRATVVAQLYAAQSVLVLPADLPLVTPQTIEGIIAKAVNPPQVIIAPDRHREGTNALLLNPVGLIQYTYGPGSFQKHVGQAEKKHLSIEIHEDPALALDLDLPEDLELLRQMDAVEIGL